MVRLAKIFCHTFHCISFIKIHIYCPKLSETCDKIFLAICTFSLLVSPKKKQRTVKVIIKPGWYGPSRTSRATVLDSGNDAGYNQGRVRKYQNNSSGLLVVW